jgi:hypothetical protein
MLKLFPAVMPAPLMVKLLILPANIEDGSVMADELANDIVADALLASMLPLMRVGELPDIVSLFAPNVNVPVVKANVPSRSTFPPSVIPLVRFKVKLFSETPGRDVLAPLPPMMMFDVPPPVKEPEVLETAPLNGQGICTN